MKKIWTKTVFQHNSITGKFELDHDESEYHFIDDDASIAQMKGSSNTGGGVTVNKSEPWDRQKDYLQRGFNEIQSQFLDTPPPEYYPGQAVAPFSQDTLNAQNTIRQNAGNIDPNQAASAGLLNDTINGKYLYGGEGFNKALQAATDKIMPSVNSSFESAGRGGSGLADTAKAGAIGNAFAGLYGQERTNQMAAAGMAPVVDQQFQNMRNQNTDRLANVGNMEENLNQQNINNDISKYDYNSNARRNSILAYMNGIQGNYGGTTTGNVPNTGTSGWMRYLMGAGGGALQGSAMGGGAGAGIGGILGLLGAM